MASSKQESSWIPVGRIVATFGLKGQVKVVPLTDFLERFHTGARFRVQGNWLTLESAALHKHQLLLKFDGIDDISDAEPLRGLVLEVPSSARPQLEEGEYLTSELIGLSVFTTKGEELGAIDRVDRAPAHDLIVVGDIVIPAVKQFVKDVDVKGKRIVVELIPGMREPG